ncbi:class I SAM-dependent methyltransferase [Actinopolymorpha sp. B9G3]|uniref:class I SAM-dependent methyltransferase n=1 Tax=Actinopolymorpha sp. B9G3 TaxID=3158970 RepID=UPI0032D8E360
MSRARTVAVDPSFTVTQPIHCEVELVRATSDALFASGEPFDHFRGAHVDLAFIDGMHLFEFVLRDFINTEAHSAASTVVVLDDVFPRRLSEAARNRYTADWTGDVYKIIPVLQRYRPDLCLVPVDTYPTGVLLILGLDPANTVLSSNYEEIVKMFVVPDPQPVPEALLKRAFALSPEMVLAAPFWAQILATRTTEAPALSKELADEVRSIFALDSRGSMADWLPESGGVKEPFREGMTRRVLCSRGVRAAVRNPLLQKLAVGLIKHFRDGCGSPAATAYPSLRPTGTNATASRL